MPVFKRARSSAEGDAPSVALSLTTSAAHPGADVGGCVHLRGGSADVHIGEVAVGLGAEGPCEIGEHGRTGSLTRDRPSTWSAALARVVVRGEFTLAAAEQVDVPFTLALPWAAPITAVGDAALPITAGVFTDVMVRDAPGAGAVAPLVIQPLPAQVRVLDALGELGTTFLDGDVLRSPFPGVAADLAPHPVLEFDPPLGYTTALVEVGVAFHAGRREIHVAVTAKKRNRWLRPDAVVVGHFFMTHEEAATTDWVSLIAGCLDNAVR
jgi:sporulation-control protein